MLIPAFTRFAEKIMTGEPGIFFSHVGADASLQFYFGTGDYDRVDFDASVYPKFCVTDWQGDKNINYFFEDIWSNDFDPLLPAADLEAIDISNVFNFEISEEIAADWIKKVLKVIGFQRSGDAWVLNLAHDYVSGELSEGVDIRAICCVLFYRFLKLDVAHCAGLIITNEQIICSMSPELFLQKEKQELMTRPIKGTGTEHYLNTSEKEKSELDMITDLLRNDLGQICSAVSVRKDRFLVAEKNFYSARSEITGLCQDVDLSLIHI